MIRVRCLVRVCGNARTHEIGEELDMLDRLAIQHIASGNVERVVAAVASASSPALAETAPELPAIADVAENTPPTPAPLPVQPARKRGRS